MGAQFGNGAHFSEAQFDSLADFSGAKFHGQTDFWGVQFCGLVYLKDAKFNGPADFKWANFNKIVDFSEATFCHNLFFESATFNNEVIFSKAHMDSIVDLSLTRIRNRISIGGMESNNIQKYDFMRTKLLPKGKRIVKRCTNNGMSTYEETYPGAKILILGPVDLKIQLEKLKFIELYDYLDYFSKKDIISILKQTSFKGDDSKRERFEVDYIFSKSTMYQKKSSDSNDYYHYIHPIRIGRFIYYATMGLGYRPFRLAWWVLGIIVVYTIIYYYRMREQINRYIFIKYEMKDASIKKQRSISNINSTEAIIKCFYFSTSLLFTFRLKGNILTFFNLKEQHIIISEYLLGLLIYISFLTLSKSGSILHTLKSLFVG